MQFRNHEIGVCYLNIACKLGGCFALVLFKFPSLRNMHTIRDLLCFITIKHVKPILGPMFQGYFTVIGAIVSRKHDDVIKWKHFPRNWPSVRGLHRFPVNSPHKGQRRGALMFYLICVWLNDWVNNREAGDLRRYCAHYDVSVMNHANVSKPMV